MRLFATRMGAVEMQSAELLERIESVVGESGILTGDAISGRSAGIWSAAPLQALALVRPASTDEVSRVMRLCHEAGQVVVPAGGMTGLAGGHRP